MTQTITRLPELVEAIERTTVSASTVNEKNGVDAHIGFLGHTMSILTTRIFVIGNGGSAAIASHVANDLIKGGMAATALCDPATLTCLANDLGYENVFSHQIATFGRQGDTLVAISSSGRSENILRAVRAGSAAKMNVYTFSGFDPDNPLSKLGRSVSFHVPSRNYGIVEIAHQFLLHCATDIACEHKAEKS